MAAAGEAAASVSAVSARKAGLMRGQAVAGASRTRSWIWRVVAGQAAKVIGADTHSLQEWMPLRTWISDAQGERKDVVAVRVHAARSASMRC